MAQFVGPKHKLYQAELPRVVEVVQAPVEPEPAEAPAAADRGWFDSSWELRKGLDVAELAVLPPESPAAGRTD